MENLGPGVREVVNAANNPDRTIDLKQVFPGDRLFIKVGERDQDLLDFIITSPAKESLQGPDDSGRGTLPGWKWSSRTPEGTVPILIAGSVTLNERAPLGFTMLSLGKVTLGRNLLIWLDETDETVIFRTPIQEITLWKVETQS